MEDNKAIELLKTRLTQSKIVLALECQNLNLAPVTAEQRRLVSDATMPHALKRLVLFLMDNQGSRTDVISSAVAIANVSDTHTPSNRIAALNSLGLEIECKVLAACNRYGDFTVIGHLWLKPLPTNKIWRKRCAANDDLMPILRSEE